MVSYNARDCSEKFCNSSAMNKYINTLNSLREQAGVETVEYTPKEKNEHFKDSLESLESKLE